MYVGRGGAPCERRKRQRDVTFEVRHMFPLLPVALRVDPSLRVTDLPGRRETRGRRGQQISAYHALLRDKRDSLRRTVFHIERNIVSRAEFSVSRALGNTQNREVTK